VELQRGALEQRVAVKQTCLELSQHMDGRAHVLGDEELLLTQLKERKGDLQDGPRALLRPFLIFFSFLHEVRSLSTRC